MKKVAPFFLFLLFTSCQKESPNIQEDNTLQTKIIDGVQYAIINEQAGDCKMPNQSGCVEINISYPQLDTESEQVQSTLDDYIKYSVSDFLATEQNIEEDADLNQYILAASLTKESETLSKKQTLKLDCTIDLLFKNKDLISLSNTWKVKENSSEMQNGVGYFMIKQPDGSVFEFDEVIEKPEELRKELLKRIKAEYGSESQNLKDMGFYISDNGFEITDNFGVSKEDMYFKYMPEEIAPAQMGILSITLSKNEVTPYLTQEFLNMWI